MSSRSKVLSIYKKLHRTSKVVFNGDPRGLTAARAKINEEFRKHLTVQEPEKIEELVGVANEAEETLRKHVIQARETQPGVYKIRITKDVLRDNPKVPPKRERRNKPKESPS